MNELNYPIADESFNEDNFAMKDSRIRNLKVVVDYVKINKDGRLQILLVGNALSGDELQKIRELLLIQKGDALVDFVPLQDAFAGTESE